VTETLLIAMFLQRMIVVLIHRCIKRFLAESYDEITLPFTRPYTQLSHTVFAHNRLIAGRRKRFYDSLNKLLAHSPFSPPFDAHNKRHYG